VATIPYNGGKYHKRVRVSKTSIKQAKYNIDSLAKYLYEPITKNTLDSIANTVKNNLYTGTAATGYLWDSDSTNTITKSAGTIDYVTYDKYDVTYDKWKWANSAHTWEYTTNNTAGTDEQCIYTIDDSQDYVTIDYNYNGHLAVSVLTPEEQKRQQIQNRLRQNLAPQILVKRFGLGNARKPSEKKAREALLSLIGAERFRRYLKNGFVSIRGRSGKIYQIFPGHKHTKVWLNGTHIEDQCVILVDHSLPPSDSVIMRMLMILDSEEEFRQVANVTRRNPLPIVAAA
jgi:hypothetical protein